MKNVFIGALALISVGAFAATKINRAVSFAELVRESQAAEQGTEGGDLCKLEVKVSERGLQLIMHGQDQLVKVFVPRSFKIRLTGTEVSDGSYEHNYTVAGKGTLMLVHMDDAYFHTTLKNLETGESQDCDIDF